MKKQQSKIKWVIVVLVLILAGGFVFMKFQKPKQTMPNPLTNQANVNDDEELKRLGASVADSWQIPDLTYDVVVANKVKDYARVIVYPTNQTLDPLQILFKKTDGKWEYVNMGTSFPDLESQMPELFTE